MQYFRYGDREFWCSEDGGYVYESTPERPGLSGYQVCGRLKHTGATLMCDKGGLKKLILSEAAKARAFARRYL